MKKLITLFLLFTIFIQPGFARTDDDILQAMRDEISRSLGQLKIESLDKPYYIEYKLIIRRSHIVKALYGSLTESRDIPSAQLNVGVRVGDYKFDNSNFFDFGLSFFGGGDQEESFKHRKIPIELDYNALRRELWLATDAAYKQVAETFTKKQTTLKSRLRKDTTHDFLKVKPDKHYYKEHYPDFDTPYFENLTKELSSIFTKYSQIDISSVGVEYLPATIYYVNSEGMEYIKNDFYTGLEIVAATQAEDGMPLANYYTAFSRSPKSLPAKDSLLTATRNVAELLAKLKNAPTLDDAYSGPIIFDRVAASQIFAQVFVPNLTTQRSQLTESGIQDNERFTAFQNKIGGRVLPEFFDVNDKPALKYFGGTELMGNYLIDDEGVKSENVLLVKKGYLKGLLSSRVPTKRVRKSNGHQRGGAPMFSNITISSDKKHSRTYTQLKKQLLKLVKDRELPYGIVVRKLIDQNIMFTTLFRLTKGLAVGGQIRRSLPAVEVYRIYPDGHEELVRGCEAKGFTHQSFKDIINAGKTNYVLNYLAPAVTSPFMSGGSQYVMASVISTSLLFEDGEIKSVEQDFPKPPLLPSPVTLK